MRGLSLGLSLGVGVVCGIVGCSATKDGGSGVTPRPVGNAGSPGTSTGGQGHGGSFSPLPGGGSGNVGEISTNNGPPDAGPDAQVDAGECATLSVQTVELVATVSLLVDTSGSMFQQPAPFWTPLHDALMDPTNGVVKQLEASTRFGFTSYTGVGDSYEDKSTYKCPILKSVPYALNNFSAIDAMYSGIKYNSEAWETPTHAAIDAAAADLVAFKATPDGPKFILLVTDGNPDTCWAKNPQCGQDAAIKSAQAAYAQGITTYVLGIGSVLSKDAAAQGCQVGRCGLDYLQDMANAGSGQPVEPYPDKDQQYQYSACIAHSPTPGVLTATYAAVGGGAKAPYSVVDGKGTSADVTPLVTAIKQALVQTRSCTFAMTATLPTGTVTGVKITTNAEKGKFNYNGNPLAYNDPNGWTLSADQTGITLNGTACNSWRTAGGMLSGSFPCEVTFDEVPPPPPPK
ncbi:MAG TPA: vWA domain-containing protein [Polyangiaceae bacterium]|nr:vWA domain-containing protein [Polyangiaceae bacterium]